MGIQIILLCALLLGLGAVGPEGATSRGPGGPGGPGGAGRTIRVVSSNVRYSAAKDGVNAWSARRELLIGVIRKLRPDLWGVQEALVDQQGDFVRAFPEYGVVGVGREDGKEKGEFASVFYLRDRFELISSGTFWLSERPEEVGSVGWDAALTRICTWVKLRDKAARRVVVYANTHFDHQGEQARVKSAELLRKKLAELAEGSAAVILTGDFNSSPGAGAYGALVGDAGGLVDSYREVHPAAEAGKAGEGSFHAFKGGKDGERIDWVLHSPAMRALDAGIDRTAGEHGVWPSDHYPVWAELQWR